MKKARPEPGFSSLLSIAGGGKLMRHAYLLVRYRVRRFWGLTDQITRVQVISADVTRPQSVGRVARLSGNIRQPDHALANSIAGNKAERRPRAGEVWRAVTKHDGVEVESILINKTKVG